MLDHSHNKNDSSAWIDLVLDQLTVAPVCGYQSEPSAASEPTALAALALAAHDRPAAARQAADWLAAIQSDDGSVGIRRAEPKPRWPTGLAVLAWLAASGCRGKSDQRPAYTGNVHTACQWILQQRGETMEPVPELGHDPRLVAWPWVSGTHSWVEPTAFQLLALKAAGFGGHARVGQAVALLLDRILPGGGCNYGNTSVFGQQLHPQVQPTAMAVLALAGEKDEQGRIAGCLDYLRRNVSADTPTVSLAWAILALSAHADRPAAALPCLESAWRRAAGGKHSPLETALVALAAAADRSPLAPPHRRRSTR